jgi:hypothetical protein
MRLLCTSDEASPDYWLPLMDLPVLFSTWVPVSHLHGDPLALTLTTATCAVAVGAHNGL